MRIISEIFQPQPKIAADEQILRIGVDWWYPYLWAVKETETIRLEGPLFNLVTEYAAKINRTIGLVMGEEDNVEQYYLESADDRIDVVLYPFMLTQYDQWEGTIKLSYPLGFSDDGVILSKIEEFPRGMFTFITGMDKMCWLSLFVAYLMCVGMLILPRSTEYGDHSPSITWFSLFEAALTQTIPIRGELHWRTFMLLTSWMIGCLFYRTLWSSEIFSEMVTPPIERIIDGMDDLYELIIIEQVKLWLFTYEGETSDFFIYNLAGQNAKYGNAFRPHRYPIGPFETTDDICHDWIMEYVGAGEAVLLSDRLYLQYLANYCRRAYNKLHVSQSCLVNVPYFLVLNPHLDKKNGSNLLPRFDQLVVRLQESGIYEYWLASYSNSTDTRLVVNQAHRETGEIETLKAIEIGWQHVAGAVLVLSLGFGVSFFMAVIEYGQGPLERKRRRLRAVADSEGKPIYVPPDCPPRQKPPVVVICQPVARAPKLASAPKPRVISYQRAALAETLNRRQSARQRPDDCGRLLTRVRKETLPVNRASIDKHSIHSIHSTRRHTIQHFGARSRIIPI